MEGRPTFWGNRTLAADEPFGAASTAIAPPSQGLVFWVSGDVGLVSVGGKASTWTNRASPTFNPNLGSLNNPPTDSGPDTGLDTLDAIPGVSFPLPNGDGRQMYIGGVAQLQLRDSTGNDFGYGPGNTQARTWVSVLRPRFAAATFNITGGAVGAFSSNPNFEPIFDLEDTSEVNAFYAFSEAWRNPGVAGSQANQAPNTAGGVGGIYNGTPLIVEWSSSGFPNISFYVNGTQRTLNALTMPGVAGVGVGTFIYGSSGSGAVAQWRGSRFEDLIYDYKLSDFPARRTQLYTYLNTRYPSVGTVIP